MLLNTYQKHAKKTAVYPAKGNNYSYPALGLTGEAGEVADKISKVIRDNNGMLNSETKLELAKELGDVLWFLAILADELGYTLNTVAEMNLRKLSDRAKRNVIHGSGDNR